jgi:hypothetical protein
MAHCVLASVLCGLPLLGNEKFLHLTTRTGTKLAPTLEISSQQQLRRLHLQHFFSRSFLALIVLLGKIWGSWGGSDA